MATEGRPLRVPPQIIIAGLFEARERTRFGTICYPSMLACTVVLMYLNAFDTTMYGIMEVLMIFFDVNYFAFRVARRKRFSVLEYTLHVLALNYIAWMSNQYMINLCINKEISLQYGGSSEDGMPDRRPYTRVVYNPALLPPPFG